MNDAPTLIPGPLSLTAVEDTPLPITKASLLDGGAAADIDTPVDALAIIITQQPSAGNLTVNEAGDFVFTPAPDSVARASFAYKVSDGALSSLIARTVNIDISE